MELQAKGLSKRYLRQRSGANNFYAVAETDFTLPAGKLTVLQGRSGSGKTTLLQLLAGLLTPTTGQVLAVEGGQSTDLYTLEDAALSRFRNRHLAVMPQGHAAVDSLTVWENILLPASLYSGKASEDKARGLMVRLGIEALADVPPGELSGGELRRMAIVRALCQEAEVLLCDEPTGDLDDENTALVLQLLREEAQAGRAVLLVTHERQAEQYGDGLWRMDGGKLTPV